MEATLHLSTFRAKNFTALAAAARGPVYLASFPGLMYTFQFEHWLAERLSSQNAFLRDHALLPIGLVLVYYLLIVRALPSFMANRKAFHLRVPLVAWNLGLAVFSLLGTIRVWPELIWSGRHFGVLGSTCNALYYDDARYFVWLHLFAYSKVAEFGDTLFIVLRKQRLITLHWVHHMLTLVYTWYSLFELPAHSRWLCAMNFAIHTIMYSYYAAMGAGLRVPKRWASYLTTAQIAQMAFGLYTQLQALWLGERQCSVPVTIATSGTVMYGIFLVMFVQLYYRKYLASPTRDKKA